MHDFVKNNSRNLKYLFTPVNLITGDSRDPNRFILNVNGIKKAWIPTNMKSLPLIQNLQKSRSLAKFLRSKYYRQNYISVSALFTHIKKLRLKYDFPYWLAINFPSYDYTSQKTLLRVLQKSASLYKPVRLLIHKPQDTETACLIRIFILWFQYISHPGIRAMIVAPNVSYAAAHKRAFLELNNYASPCAPKLRKLPGMANTVLTPHSNGRIWTNSAFNPEGCRSLDFSLLYISDMHLWNTNPQHPSAKVIPATFPVILNSPDTMIILESGPLKRNSIFSREIEAAKNNQSPFSYIQIPWFDNPRNTTKFDSFEDKVLFYQKLLKHHNSKSFPSFPYVKGKYLYKLWTMGIPLESLYWYATEAPFHQTRARFHNHYPPT